MSLRKLWSVLLFASVACGKEQGKAAPGTNAPPSRSQMLRATLLRETGADTLWWRRFRRQGWASVLADSLLKVEPSVVFVPRLRIRDVRRGESGLVVVASTTLAANDFVILSLDCSEQLCDRILSDSALARTRFFSGAVHLTTVDRRPLGFMTGVEAPEGSDAVLSDVSLVVLHGSLIDYVYQTRSFDDFDSWLGERLDDIQQSAVDDAAPDDDRDPSDYDY